MVFVDECFFTYNTKLTHGFAQYRSNCIHPEEQRKLQVVHLIAAISFENGLEGYLMYEGSVNSFKFVQILKQLKQHGTDYTLLGDNASWHKSKEFLQAYKDNRIWFILNVPYSPQLNTAELYFDMLKAK